MSDGIADVFDDLVPGPPGRLGSSRAAAEVVPLPSRVSAPAEIVRPALPFEWANDLGDEIPAPLQIVEGVVTAGGFSVIYGESNSGKTYLAMHMGICVSLGYEWLGKRTQRGAVVYVAAEGAWSVRMRLAAFRSYHRRPFGYFAIIPSAVSLMEPSVDVEDLIEAIIERVGAVADTPASLVIIDTVARVMGGANENASEDMSRLVAACDRIREETGAHVMLVHHSGKDAAKGARGHSSLRAAVDTEIEVTADETEHIHTAKITKQRDLPSKGERIAGKFVSVELGHDQWGGAITACVVEPAEVPQAAATKPKVNGSAQQAVLGFLAGQSAGVRKAALVEALEPQGIGRASVYRAINTLAELGLVTDALGLIYAPKG